MSFSPSREPRSQGSRTAALRRRRVARIAAVTTVIAVAFAGAAWVNRSPPVPGRSHARHAPTPAPAACGAEPPSPHRPKLLAHAPALHVPHGVNLGAVIHTSCGTIRLDLLEKTAPKNVANFVFLARNGFYDGRRWFRVENDSVIETGDPNDRIADPPDGPGYTIPDELPAKPHFYVFGVVAMANTGQPHSAGSQFFIVIHHDEPAGYDPRYSIFGRVEPGSYDVLDRIGEQKTYEGNDPVKSVTPVDPIFIESVEILER